MTEHVQPNQFTEVQVAAVRANIATGWQKVDYPFGKRGGAILGVTSFQNMLYGQ